MFVISDCLQGGDMNTTLLPRVVSPASLTTGHLGGPFTCTDVGQTQTYSNAYSSYTYSPYSADSYAAAAVAAAKARPTPYSRNMEYGGYGPTPGSGHRMNGLYPRPNLGYGYEAR